ncbi:MAG: complex I subunit 5 family protein [Gammaproteobacteria bacterium]
MSVPSVLNADMGVLGHAMALPVVLPLLAAFLLPSLNRVFRPMARIAGPAVLAGCLVVLLHIGSQWDGEPFSVALGGFAPPLGINFYVDGLSLLFATLVVIMGLLLWPSIHAGDDSDGIREHALTLLLIGASVGLVLSGDLFNMYVFYELVSVASFGLVAARATGAAYVAGFRYLMISGLGSVFALTGIALIYTHTGTLNIAHLGLLTSKLDSVIGLTGFAFIALGLGVKAELFPVNTWVPEVYATAPRRITALLAGVISKVAVLALVRVLVLAFPGEEARQLLLILGVSGVVFGELAAYRAKDMARMLAWSSIGQLGLVFVAFSLPGEEGMFVGIALALHHLVIKPGLFLLAEHWGGALSALHGEARQGAGSLWAGLLFVLFALSLVGVPPLPGFWAKLSLAQGLVAQESVWHVVALMAILGATVIEANYLFTVAVRLFSPTTQVRPPQHGVLNLATSSALAGVLVVGMLAIAPLGERLGAMAGQSSDAAGYITTVASDAVKERAR